ncbi:hypothetical protein MLD38_018584 [Melastoma candidum]|uniref:Uncharacterized protein n=1 Tax=Melastoma candidum TaxID=119954 RepID=A0ACB9QUG7_9MYRT|nr:hypothetical protein MLD38_018584 [Melastoma candidum]
MVENGEVSIPLDLAYDHVTNSKQGGVRATLFVFAMIFFDNIGFVANMMSIVLYLMFVIKFDVSGSATTTTNFLGATFLVTIIGGFVSDLYMTRLNTTLLSGLLELLGYALLIVQSDNMKLQPQSCMQSSCVHGLKALLFYASLCLVGLGGGGIRGSAPALGADQFDPKNPQEGKKIASYFNWYLLSTTLGATIGVTFIVYLSTEIRWAIGYGVSMGCCVIGLVFVACGKPFYRVRKPGESPLLRVFEVLVAAVMNWKSKLPENSDLLHEIHDRKLVRQTELIPHTAQFRFLDKAAVVPDESQRRTWKICTVTQVEEVKILARMMPILLSTILMNTCLAQLQTFSVQQGTLMDTRLGNFKVPPSSIPVIPLIFMSVLIPAYEFTAVPVLRKFTGHPNGITHLQRVGVGLVLSALSMAVAGFVEVKRKHALVHDNHMISLFWLSYHYAIFGIADMFTLVGLLEFFYSEAPAGMRSLSTSFTWLSLSIGYFINSPIIDLVNASSRRSSKTGLGWVEGRDMNSNHLERFYWFLAVLSTVNFANYLFWANWYKYKNHGKTNTVVGDEVTLLRATGPMSANGMPYSASVSVVSPSVQDSPAAVGVNATNQVKD